MHSVGGGLRSIPSPAFIEPQNKSRDRKGEQAKGARVGKLHVLRLEHMRHRGSMARSRFRMDIFSGGILLLSAFLLFLDGQSVGFCSTMQDSRRGIPLVVGHGVIQTKPGVGVRRRIVAVCLTWLEKRNLPLWMDEWISTLPSLT